MKASFLKHIIFIVGPTAVGKTDVALKLAGEIPSEIISCDSMQVYRDVSIASSKPSLSEQKKVPHHLLDVVSVEEKFDVAVFNRMARKEIEVIFARKRCPIVVGGSGMYMQILLDGIFDAGGKNVALRNKLEERAQTEGPAVLYKELQKVDHAAAAKIHANDARRIVRALEVFYTIQKPISQLRENRSGLWGHYPVTVFGLNRERDELYRRINLRVEQMFSDGLLKEVKAISGRQLSETACRIIGVKEVLSYLAGECDLNAAKELMKMNTRRFAKRQLTWFRRDKRINWLMIGPKDTVELIVKKILKKLEFYEVV
ncbi:MAG: tRNA (adenosine(37)-N6)-dimethylallyltransferase MiaA [Candidatus Omnitrophica bacterium]|nr:tRNA (adenosine(37)-N6)-dimethylallyltransferase MiaA [Candidatus Omnitrophota bacterium]